MRHARLFATISLVLFRLRDKRIEDTAPIDNAQKLLMENRHRHDEPSALNDANSINTSMSLPLVD